MGAYRFIEHHKVTPSKILIPHKNATVSRIKEQEIRYSTLVLNPLKRPNTTLEPTQVYVVHAKEINVPEGEKAIDVYKVMPSQSRPGLLNLRQS